MRRLQESLSEPTRTRQIIDRRVENMPVKPTPWRGHLKLRGRFFESSDSITYHVVIFRCQLDRLRESDPLVEPADRELHRHGCLICV